MSRSSLWLVFCLLGISWIIQQAECHSYVACTDYTGGAGGGYDEGKCRGWPRGWYGMRFGDSDNSRGFDHKGQNCQLHRGAGKNKPDARYSRGQQVTLAWPAMNHVTAQCHERNKFGSNRGFNHPDNFLKLYASASNHNPGPHGDQIWDFGAPGGVGRQGTGYQRCGDYCSSDPNDCVCTGTFQIPDNMADGTYTFKWLWELNKGEWYTTCWEATVGGGAPVSGGGGGGGGGGAPPSGGGGGDGPPPGSPYSCQQQRDWGKCGESWMKGYCCSTCGNCGGGGNNNPPPGSPYSCQQQKDWGKCGESWMRGHCCSTCGNCGGHSTNNPPPGSPYSCDQQRGWGKCGESWMRGYCCASCGNC